MKLEGAALEAEIARRWQAKESMTAIGKALGVSRNVIVGRLRKLRRRGAKIESRPAPVGLAKASPHAAAKRAAIEVSAETMSAVGTSSRVHVGYGFGHISAMSSAPVSGCRFIGGDDFLARMRRGEPIYCGKPIAHIGESWCAAHRAAVFTPAKPRAGY